MKKTYTYIVRHDVIKKDKNGCEYQLGGDRYALYISEAYIKESEFMKHLKNNKTEQEVGKILTNEYGKEVLLSGAIILKRGTPFENIAVYSKKNEEDDIEELYNELSYLIDESNEEAQKLLDLQQKIVKLKNKLDKEKIKILKK